MIRTMVKDAEEMPNEVKERMTLADTDWSVEVVWGCNRGADSSPAASSFLSSAAGTVGDAGRD